MEYNEGNFIYIRRHILLSYIDMLLDDPIAVLTFFLLALPGRLLAISAHEFAHAWMADRCGDPTARMLGRLTLNPIKHLDLVGTLMMLVLGFGWARPVPVNPHNFRNYRRDDLKVSIAGVTMNLILFIIGFLAMGLITGFTLHSLPHHMGMYMGAENLFVTTYAGEQVLVSGEYYYVIKDLFVNAPYLSEILITPVLGKLAGYAYDMLMYFVLVNIALAVFNLLPVPPLDGYHVVNDLLLKRSLFASPKFARIASGVLMMLVFCTDIVSNLIQLVQNACMSGLGTGLFSLLGTIGFI